MPLLSKKCKKAGDRQVPDVFNWGVKENGDVSKEINFL